MSYNYFSQKLKPSDDREQLLYYAGMFEAFQDIISSNYAGNQPGFNDDVENPGQFVGFVISKENGLPDDGLYIEVYPDGRVLVTDRISYPDPKGGDPIVSAEDYFTTIKNILNWLRTQPPKFHGYL